MRFVPFALRPDAFQARLSRLRWTFSKWDTHVAGRSTVAPGALVLSRSEHDEIVRASEAMYQACDEAMPRLARDDEATRLLGVDRSLRDLARARAEPRVTRMDFFLTEDGWRVSEFNDDVPGGYNDALGLVATFADAVEKGLEVPGDLSGALVRLLAPTGRERVGLAYATAYAEDLQVVRLLADLLATEGVASTLASPAHLERADGITTLGGEPIDVAYRFFPAEWFPALQNFSTWKEAIENGLRVVNPFAATWTQSKASFIPLSSDPRCAPYLPQTRALTPEAAREALHERERWVLKPCFGRMGEGVVLGATRSQDEWRKALDGALRGKAAFVLQRRFRPVSVDVGNGASASACVGAYVVDGRFAGYYTRFSSKDTVRFDATNVLTLLEAV